MRFCVVFELGILLSLLGLSSASSQTEVKTVNVYDLKAENPADVSVSEEDLFSTTEVPAKWNGESAVILAQRIKFEYGNFSSPKYKVAVRKRIKLLDNNAVSNFSRLYAEDKNTLKIRVIKKNGKKREIDTEAAIKVNRMPGYYDGYIKSNDYYKVAVPDLEVGDIIDFEYESSRWDLSYKENQHFGFPLLHLSLSGKYPRLAQQFIFRTAKEDHLTMRFSQKKFPVIFRTVEGYDKEYEYEVLVTDMDKRKGLRWEYEHLATPTLKVQVVFSPANSEKDVYRYFPRNPNGSLKDSINNEEWKYYYKKFSETEFPLSVLWANRISPSLKQYRNSTDVEFTKGLYLAYRKFYYQQSDINVDRSDLIYDDLFVQVMKNLLKRFDRPFTIGIAFAASKGGDQNITSFNEGYSFIEVDGVFFFPFNYFSLPGNIPSHFQNGFACSYDIDEKGNYKLFRKRILGGSKPEDNVTSRVKSAQINLNDLTLEVIESTESQGVLISDDFQSMILDPTYFRNRDGYFLDDISLPSGLNKKEKAFYEKRVEQAKNEMLLDYQLDYLNDRKENSDDIHLSSYDSLKVYSTGRVEGSDKLHYEEQYAITRLLHRLKEGYYVLNIGKLIGAQVELDPDEFQRSTSAHLTYPRTFNYTIKCKIPSGYQVIGIENLNAGVSNEVGAYSSAAKLVGGELVWEISKVYKVIDVDPIDWLLLTDMLETAFQNTQKKVFLKKI